MEQSDIHVLLGLLLAFSKLIDCSLLRTKTRSQTLKFDNGPVQIEIKKSQFLIW